MKNKKFTFLFGSGADTAVSDSLKSGASFSEVLLTDKYKKTIANLLGSNYSNFKLLYHGSRKIFIQTIIDYEDEFKKIIIF